MEYLVTVWHTPIRDGKDFSTADVSKGTGRKAKVDCKRYR